MSFPRNLVKRWGAEIGWKCEKCGRLWKDGWKLEGHHIIPQHNGGKHTRSNFILLCVECHEKAHRKLAEMDTLSANIVHNRFMKTNGKWR